MSLRERLNQDSVCGVVVLLIVLIFWLQRGYTNPLSSYFPDTVLVVIAVLAAVLVVLGLLRPGSASFPEVPNLRRLLVAVGLLGAWVLLIGPLGYLIGSILMFLAISLFLRERPITARNVAVDGAVSVVVVGFLYFIFTNVLIVTLPPIPFT